MDHLHIRLPADLKSDLKKHCRDQNIAVTSAVIMMIIREMRERHPAPDQPTDDQGEAPSLGFVLRQ